jgi:hypothetical protein
MPEWLTIQDILKVTMLVVLPFMGRMIWKLLKEIHEDHKKAVDNIQILLDTTKDPKDPKGSKIISRSELMSGVYRLNENLMEHCGNSKCPIVPIVSEELKKLKHEFEKRTIDMTKEIADLNKNIVSTHSQFIHISDQTFGRVNSFMDEFGGNALLLVKQLMIERGQK